MSDPLLSDIDFKDKMPWVLTTLKTSVEVSVERSVLFKRKMTVLDSLWNPDKEKTLSFYS